MSAPRVRFAPSPTGYFHVGSARTALFNWFVARQDPNGVFIVRIEDTDASRNREEWMDGIYSALAWMGMTPDEGPYRQSENADAHALAAASLLEGGYLYYCDCTPEALAARKGDDKTPGYDGYCRDRGLEKSENTALRFKTPREGVTVVHDLIRGDVEFLNHLIDDFVVVRSNGGVLYGLANVVDDRKDRITHLIRGEDGLANAPKQMMMWRALSETTGTTIEVPAYAHLPLLVNEQRKKLSKRKDPVFTESYRDQGYLSAAFVNYLALLGWSPHGDEEIVPYQQLVREFRLEDVSHSPAFFDVKKLTSFNGDYIRALSDDAFITESAPWVCPWTTSWQPSDRDAPWPEMLFDAALYEKVAPLIKERVATLGEIPSMIRFFFQEPDMDEAAFNKVIKNDPLGQSLLRAVLATLPTFEPWDAVSLHAEIQKIGEGLGLPLRKAQAPVRCAVTGSLVGPPLFESLELLGRDTTLRRLESALKAAS